MIRLPLVIAAFAVIVVIGTAVPVREAADLGSVTGFVLEVELELGAISDRPALI